jgi:phage-related holin
MSELASYSIQAIFFALVAVVVVSRSKKTDLYQFALISIWLIGVIAIYARYREGQVLFYSNDQEFHRLVIEYYLPVEGIQVREIIGLRYLLAVPVYFISLLGFDAMLIIKFLQLSALLLLYKRSQQFLSEQSLQIRFWQLPLIAGPILIFMSLLSLRDVLLAYFALVFVTSVPLGYRILGLSGAFALRPHLGVALAFGFVISHFYSRWKPKLHSLSISIIGLLSYVLGTSAYWIGAVIQQGANYDSPNTVFTQFKFSQLGANFLGLQFLALNDSDNGLVAASTFTLLVSRLVFFDTLLIPVLFLIAVFRHPEFLMKQKGLAFHAFMFFYGVVSQTSFNSTRQNIPFLACMGVLAVADIEHFRKIKAKVAPKLLMATR